MRSMAQFQRLVNTIPTNSTISSDTMIDVTPSRVIRTRNNTNAITAESMKRSPWAKFTMPMMPNTIV